MIVFCTVIVTDNRLYGGRDTDSRQQEEQTNADGNADGRLRKTEKPKKKKLIHLRPTNTVLEPEAWRSNLQLRHSLDAFIQKG